MRGEKYGIKLKSEELNDNIRDITVPDKIKYQSRTPKESRMGRPQWAEVIREGSMRRYGLS